jgi:hypothetical protein
MVVVVVVKEGMKSCVREMEDNGREWKLAWS